MSKLDPSSIVVFITGASSGLGQSTANHLSSLGYKVYGTSRKEQPGKISYTMLTMDVRDEASVVNAVKTIIEKEGKIDVLLNNAGYGIGGSIMDSTPKMAEDQLDTNFFGVYRVQHHVLKHMKNRGEGLIINMSSIGGVIGLPYQGLYSASKFAVEGMTEALYKEMRHENIRVCMIEPGDFKTGFTASRENIKGDDDRLEKARAVIESDEQGGKSPIMVAKLVERIIKKRNPKLRYVTGAFYQKITIFLKKILPNRWFDAIIAGYYKVK
jgi:NAD(P)-dependent dehydrogenase (short-subunit alcohol dehydrogenase family)